MNRGETYLPVVRYVMTVIACVALASVIAALS